VADESDACAAPLPLFSVFPLSPALRVHVHHAQAAHSQAAFDHPDGHGRCLVAQLNQRWAALESLNATVEIQASVLKSKEGVAKDYTTFRGHILMRKPEMLRVWGRFRCWARACSTWPATERISRSISFPRRTRR
jgi:hypothetical protein